MTPRSPSFVPIKDSVATQLLKTVFALYLVLVVSVTLLQLTAQYLHTKDEVLQELKALEATLKPGLTQALWELNEPQIHSIASGIARLSTVVGVRICDNEGKIIERIGDVRLERGAHEQQSRGMQFFWHDFSLTHNRGEQNFPLGNVAIYSNSTVIFQRIHFGFQLLGIAALLQITAFGILFLWISRRTLSRPLAELTDAAGQLDLDNLREIRLRVPTSTRNELRVLEDTFNAMVRKLQDARSTLYQYANELQRNQQQLQDILDNATAVIFLKDTEGRYLLINRQYEEVFHISKPEILGKTDFDVFSQDAADMFRENDRQVLDLNAPLEVEESAPHDDGLHTYMSIKFPLHDVDGKIYAVCGIATDISARKKAENEIRILNQELEQRVQERTARLSETNILLKNSEQRLKEAQRIARLGNWEWNIHKDELSWSDEIYRIFGVSPQEFAANSEAFFDAIHPDDRDAVRRAVHAALHEGESYNIIHRIVRPDGKVRTVHEQGEISVNEQQAPLRMLGTVQDVSEWKEAEEALRSSEHQLRLITDNTPAYIAYVGADDLRYRFVNRNFEIAYARSREQLIGQHIKDIIGDANYQFALPYIEKVKRGQAIRYENSFPLKHGTRWIQVNYVPDFDEQGVVRAIVVMSHDITDLRQATEAAEAASRAKSTFLANMSHELRTPLHGILGFTQMLKRDSALGEKHQEHLSIIQRNGEHLLTMLNDILDFTRIEANTLELQPSKFVLASLLEQLCEIFRLQAAQKNLRFLQKLGAELPSIVSGDQKRLRQILSNLLGNAVRFTKDGSVTLEVLKIPAENADNQEPPTIHLRFSIQDTGPGIDPEHLAALFQPFQQANPQQIQEGSRGLGLAISQRFVQMMGSQLHVTSTPGIGSTFWFDVKLPVFDMNEMAVLSPKSEPPLEFPSRETLGNALAALPADWLEILVKGASDVDLEALSDIIRRIHERDPILASALNQLTEEFEYDEMLRLIQESL